MHSTALKSLDRATALTILVAGLGYFVDIFDLLLFSIVRVQSLHDLGIPPDQILALGIRLFNCQMAGLLLGGFMWGVLGDKFGRISVLLGSILLYSVANLANGFATSIDQYALLRFVAGIGLAGELGAGVTLASELLPKEWRGLGTTFIATVGVLGATFAAILANLTTWRTAFIVGGIIGLLLLALRVRVQESGLFKRAEGAGAGVSRGNLLILLRPALLKRYIAVILVGAPLWGTIGLFITFTPEFAAAMGMNPLPSAGNAVLFSYFGLAIGDALSGLLSQYLRSRRKAVALSLCLLVASIALYVALPGKTIPLYYGLCALLGISVGYWAMFIQMGAEQFGTNIRATAATTVPNLVRGAAIPITAGFHALIPMLGITASGVVIMAVLIALSFLALTQLRETFGVDLDYLEI